MNDSEITQEAPAPAQIILDGEEQRILGVLIEKGLATPQSYPMTLNSIVTACCQRSNRDPIVHYDEAQVARALERLQQRGLVTRFFPGEGGRVDRWRQDLGKNLELRGAELAVIAELFLRGPQSTGELRQRASRMRDIPTLADLQQILDGLASRSPPLAVRLTRAGLARGVRYAHACRVEAEMQQVLAAEESGAAAPAGPASCRAPQPDADLQALREQVRDLEGRVARIEAALGARPAQDAG
ncbi:MAG: DUF480 domain-containing protein [Planctomycetes bacterium]|nr:DUF480 domain-containing protein [Planctomycetota bacterium]